MTDDYLEPYRRAVESTGPGFEALLWRNRQFQETRFKVLLEVAASGLSTPDSLANIIKLEGRVIADMGAGRADLLLFMHSIGLRYGRYIGVEAITELAEAAEHAITEQACEEASIIPADFANDPSLMASLVNNHGVELFMFSGSLNTFEQDQAVAVITNAYRAIEHQPASGVIFNFLSDRQHGRQHEDTGPARRFDTIALARFAAELTPRFVLRHDYLSGHDATIGLFTAPRPGDA